MKDNANFNDTELSFQITKQPYTDLHIPTENFKLGKPNTEAHIYRLGHPLAQKNLEVAKMYDTPTSTLVFDLSGYEGNINALEHLKNNSGWLQHEASFGKAPKVVTTDAGYWIRRKLHPA